MFIAALVIIAENWKLPKCVSMMNGETNCGISIPWITDQQRGGPNLKMQKRGCILRKLCGIKEVNAIRSILHNCIYITFMK